MMLSLVSYYSLLNSQALIMPQHCGECLPDRCLCY